MSTQPMEKNTPTPSLTTGSPEESSAFTPTSSEATRFIPGNLYCLTPRRKGLHTFVGSVGNGVFEIHHNEPVLLVGELILTGPSYGARGSIVEEYVFYHLRKGENFSYSKRLSLKDLVPYDVLSSQEDTTEESR